MNGRAIGIDPTPDHPHAWVVFGDAARPRWLALLKPGFRHCFVALYDGAGWITIDPLSTHMEVTAQPVPAGFDLPEWYRSRGLTAIPAAIDWSRRDAAPWGLFTCVEAVKRMLGLRAHLVLTPHQLYRRLARPDPSPGPSDK